MKALVVGGAGFIGSNMAKRFIEIGYEVTVLDNLSRIGAKDNLEWLRSMGNFKFIRGDILDYNLLKKIFSENDLDIVVHQAAQVAVTTSVTNPREDFEINALGTFNLLEAIRESGQNPIVLYASTNKVYGEMKDDPVIEQNGRYQYKNLPFGVSESRSLDFHSPYGCSKGCADQYVHDYARIYGLRTVVFRQSCIYGYRQFGIEDQGWVAWFTIASVLGKPISIYGDGKQVRDILFIDDLIDAYVLGIEKNDQVSGKVYNIGGGPRNQVSVLEVLDLLKDISRKKNKISFKDWRPGDQKIFMADIRQIKYDTGWVPKVSVKDGLRRLYNWVAENKKFFEKMH